MKWINKGKELIRIKERICKEKIYIYGAGEYGKNLFERLKPVQDRIVFIDESAKKQREGYCGRKVISPDQISGELLKDAVLVVAASESNTVILTKKLTFMGLWEGRDFFTYRMFVGIYLPIYLYYSAHKIYFQDITILITEKCTLKCKKCAPMYPYLKNPKHRTLEEVKEDLDLLFSTIDYVWDLIFTGGEPFLHPNFYEILKYTIENYKEKFGHIQIISNGTVVPGKELLTLMGKKDDLYISVSNYAPHIKEKNIEKKVNDCMEAYDTYRVKYEINNSEHWVDFGFEDNVAENKVRNSKNLIRFFDDCNSSCRAFFKGHFVYCVPALYSDIAINNKSEEDWDLDNFYILETQEELLEWSLGFSRKGYLEMCKFCNGYITINSNLVKPAQQLDRKGNGLNGY